MLALIKALGRLFLMALVMVVVVSASVLAGLATTVTVGLAVVFAGLVGLIGVGRRRDAPAVPAELLDDAEVELMAPEAAAAVATIDPESLMPRWRRPSLLAARHADPARRELAERPQMRFRPEHAPTTAELRVVRYAVVPLLDRPDEVLGLQIMDLIAGDEVQVVETSSAFWEIVCPDGERGWVHRTTLALPSVVGREIEVPQRSVPSEADDALSALLAARGLN
jgi:hypothetical protein